MTLDLRDTAAPTYSPNPTGGEGSFRKGLRSGLTHAGGQLQALTGRVAETLGADEFAANRYAASEQALEQSQAEAPEINDYRQIDSLRTAGSYLAGQAGAMVPMLAAGAVGAKLAPASLRGMGSLAGATVATTPLTIGGAVQRQQASPEAMNASLTDRNLTAAGSGVLEAGLSNIVPQFFGGKLMGRGAENVVSTASKKAILAKNMSEGIIGQGATAAGIEKMHQMEETHFDPNRDTSQDNQRMMDAGISGAIVGAPFGVAGAGGELAHRRTSAATDGNMFTRLKDKATEAAKGIDLSGAKDFAGKAKDAATDAYGDLRDRAAGVDLSGAKEFASGAVDKAKGVVDGVDMTAPKEFAANAYTKMRDLISGNREPVDLTAARDIVSGKHPIDSIDPEMLASASPEARSVMAEQATASRMDQTKQMFNDLINDRKLSEESRAALSSMGDDFASAANQMKIATLKLAEDSKAKLSSAVDSAYELAQEQYAKTFKNDGKAKSEMGEGIRQVVSDTVMPFLQQHRPELLSSTKDVTRIGESLRMIAATFTSADIDMQSVRYMRQVFGGDKLREILVQVHEAIGSDADPVATKNFFKAIGKLRDREVSSEQLSRAVSSGHDAEVLKQRVAQNPDYLETMVEGIRSHMDESAYVGMSKAKADHMKTEFALAMQKEFGSKSKSMLAVFAKHAEQDSTKSQLGRENPDQFNEDGHDVAGGDKDMADNYEAPKYYGVGKGEQPGMLDHPNDHRLKYNSVSPAEKLLAKAQKENPDRTVSMVRFEDLPPEVQANYPDGDGMVLIQAEGLKQEGRMSSQDLESVRVNTDIASHRESPSRIDTGVKGAVIDARKLVKQYQSEAKTPRNESDAKGDLHRMSRVFMEGIAAVQDHLGKAFEVPDSTVVGVNGKRDITWGELKKLKFAPEEKGPSELSEFLRDATPNEMRRELKPYTDMLNEHQIKVDDKIDSIKNVGVRLSKAMIKEIVASLDTPEIVQARKAAFLIENAIKNFGRENTLAEESGKREIGADDNPHEMREAAGVSYKKEYSGKGRPEPLNKTEQGLVNHVSLDGTAIRHTGFAKKRTQVDEIVSRDAEIKERIMKMGKSPVVGMREMAENLRDLRKLETYKKMSEFDRDRLGVDILAAKKASDLKEIVAALTKKYLGDKAPDEASQWGGSELKKTNALSEKASEGEVRQSKQTPGKTPLTAAETAQVEAMIKGSLGDDVVVEFDKMFFAGEYKRVKNSAGLKHDLIRLSVHNLDPMSVGFHETLHGFIQHMREADLHGVNKALYQAADSLYVRGKIREFLKNEPEALKQIESKDSSGTEERAAYMYQMWAAGKLELHEAPKSILQKISDFIKNTMGIWTTDKRAENIMQYLRDGEYAKTGLGDRSAVARALLESGTNKSFESVKQTLAPLARISHEIVSTGDSVLESMKNPSIDKLRKMISANTNDEGKGTGWISASRIAKTTEMNGLMNALAKNNVTAEHMRGALEQLQSGKPANSPEARLLAHESGPIRTLLDKLHDYATEAGVDLGDRGKGSGYFPVVWDISHIASNQKAFRAMLDKYVRSGHIRSSDSVIKSLLSNDGNDVGIETNRPGMEFAKQRKLDFITKEDRAEFLQKDMMMTMSSYINQITRRAEWARRFGDKSEGLNQLLAEAKKQHGATDREIATVDKFIKGVDGSLGDTIDPGLRRLYGNAIVYQNLRLLPFAVFSMAVDPGGIMVRGGTMKDAFTAFKRGITEVKRGFDKNPSKDEWYEMAETMGVIDNATLVHTLGTSYSQGMVGDTGRKINDTFFKFNLVEQMNTSMRVAAIPAALKFMTKHADGTDGVHSKRWLAELDLEPGDVVVKNGKPLTTQAEFEAHGMSPEKALASEVRMRLAVNKWVDGAILRPNAAHKPGWMNDPRFALISHLKQFVFSFNETIIKRVINEARYGNYTPAYAVASYIPTMMAADFMKGMILGGGSQPAYKDDWDLGDYIGSGIQRSGLLMTSQFGLDAYKNLKMGGTGVQALLGPQIEQLADGIETLGGRKSVSSTVLDAAPISPIVKAISRNGVDKPEPTFID